MDKLAAQPTSAINIYDFDNTIYRGDASLGFYFFCLRRQPSLLRYFPYQAWYFLLYLMRVVDKTAFKSAYFVFLRGLGDTKEVVNKFWEKRFGRIKRWYLTADHSKDVIISASPEFLLLPVFNELKAHKLIATKVDAKTGIIKGNNCRGEEKVARLLEVLDGSVIESTYTDTLSDLPILGLAKNQFIVKGDKILSLKAYVSLPLLERALLTLRGRFWSRG